jgi:hypothetical protein
MASSAAARWGLIVFVIGILLLLGVFFLSYRMFGYAAGQLVSSETTPVGFLKPISHLIFTSLMKLGCLIVMGYIASLIAGKGLALLKASREEAKK